VAALAAIVMLVGQMAGVAQDLPATLVLTETNNGTVANAVVGQPITVNLHGNPSTGFEWLLTNTDGDSARTNGPTIYTPDADGMPGGGGTFSFPFLAVGTGDTTLAFEERRPWEGGTVIANFAVRIHVRAGGPRLWIELARPNVRLLWPIAGSSGFFLEGTLSLEPAQWAALNVLPLPEGTNYVVTLGPGGKGLYFRLHK
jgi:inhibitor of cysteine peptidase